MHSPVSQFSFWYAALKTRSELTPAELPEFLRTSSESDAKRAHHMAEQLAGMDPDVRRQLIGIIRDKVSAVPWSAIHPSWIRSLIRDWPPQWRFWALECLPAATRELLQKSIQKGTHIRTQGVRSPLSKPVVVDGHVPAWWPAWFGNHVRRTLKYPDLPPWTKSSADAELPGGLWEMDDNDLVLILRLHGTSGFVGCLRKLPRAEGQQLIWQLPTEFQSVASEVVQGKKWISDPFWPQVFTELKDEFPAVGDRLVWMALADWTRVGLQQAQGPLLRRMAYRLHRKYGKWMLRKMETSPEWIALPVQPGIDAWRQTLQDLIQTLRQAGRIQPAAESEGTAR